MKSATTWRDHEFHQLPVGGKARALGALSRGGFDVPAWIVILPDAAVDPIPDECGAFLDSHPGPYAVRSSASDEDGASHSFAGQLESFLNVSREDLIEKIHAVRQSGFSERMAVYRQQAGLPMPPPTPAVILQQMVMAEFAGVAFSADPVSGCRGIAVVASVCGLGESLVSGESTGNSYRVNRCGEIVQREVAEASELADNQILEIAALSRLAARHFGRPQDIEWAISAGRLHLLQSRPITSLGSRPDPDGAWQLWDNSNIAESYSGVTTPLTFSFAKHIYEEVYRQFVKILCVPSRRIEAQRDVFGRMLGLIRGRIYYNLLSWYRVLAMLPGFAINRRFMEQMMGVKEPLPDSVVAEIVGAPRKSSLRDYVEIAATLGGLLINHLLLKHKIAAFYQRLNQALATTGIPLEELRPDELAAAYRRLQNQLLTRWDAPLINDFFAMIYFGLSRKLVDAWCGDPDGTLQNDLITCQGGIISAEPAKRMLRLAELARSDESLMTLLESDNPADAQEAVARSPEFQREYVAYLEKFGDRCLEELKLESATLHDDPLMLLHSIARLARGPIRQTQNSQSISNRATMRVKQALSGHPIRKLIFHFVIQQTRSRIMNRENLRFERTRIFGRVRRIFLELGKRLHALDLLDEPRDVFYLETEEVMAFVEGCAVTLELAALARLRRREFEQFNENPPADRFETRGMVYSGNKFCQSTPQTVSQGEERKGVGCCPGVVRGRARVILDPRNAEILPGEILVAPRTDPGWIMLFPAAEGLLVEHGSLLSHSAIVAREMGIPAVVSIGNLTSWLKTGDLVELDGSSGRVSRLQEGRHAE